jgi:hypothetical protein
VGEPVAVEQARVAEDEPLGRVEGGGDDVGHAATVGPGAGSPSWTERTSGPPESRGHRPPPTALAFTA